MTKIERGKSSVPALPPARHQPRPCAEAARRNDLLRRGVLAALRRSGRYSVVTNMRVPVPEAAREAVRRSRRSVATQARCETVVIDMVVVDAPNSWAGGYAFCSPGAQSLRARRRIEEDLRAAELVLAPHVSRTMASRIDTVTVGIIDGCADPEECDDLTIAASEISDRFDIPFVDPEAKSFESAARAGRSEDGLKYSYPSDRSPAPDEHARKPAAASVGGFDAFDCR